MTMVEIVLCPRCGRELQIHVAFYDDLDIDARSTVDISRLCGCMSDDADGEAT